MISNADHLVNEEKRSLATDLAERAAETADSVTGQTADDRKAVARLGGGGLALLEREARVARIKAAAQERREQRNARRLAHANRGSRIDQTDF